MDGRFKRHLVTCCNELNLDQEKFDIDSLWDDSLNYYENKKNIKEMLHIDEVVFKKEFYKLLSRAIPLIDQLMIIAFLEEEYNLVKNAGRLIHTYF